MAENNNLQTTSRRVGSVFAPAAPITTRDLFFGRIDQLNGVVSTIMERGQHGVLYGDRGVGKTSLANILHEKLANIVVAKVTCSRTDTFRDIWEKAFKKIRIMAKTSGLGFTAQEVEHALQLSLFMPEEERIDATDILTTLEFLSTPVLFIFDEYDSITDQDTRARFADTIKALSDNAPNVTILIVGVAKDVTNLIGSHPSNERSLRQILLPRMSSEEVGEIIDNGLKILGMTIEPFVRLDIIEFSMGFPHYAHLLSKYAAQAALKLGSIEISRDHFNLSLDDALENVQESTRDLYQRAILSSHKHALYPHVVHACALVRLDEHGTFRATDLVESIKKVSGKSMSVSAFGGHLAKLCSEERGAILEQVGRGKIHQYRFRNPLLRAFIRIKLYQSGLVSGSSGAPTN
jgi:Cdc6-like AAA superfamily ATPase